MNAHAETKPDAPVLRLEVVEVGRAEGGEEFTDFLIADEGVRHFDVMVGKEPIYCQVADRLTADIFVRAVNCFPELLAALKAVVSVADRKTVEFDAARAAIAKAEGRQTAADAINAVRSDLAAIEGR